MKLRTLLKEMSANATLYHRSHRIYKVGDKIKPEDRKAVLEDPCERALELYRKQFYPDAPSRFTSVFATTVPRSRFRTKGHLYTVRIGTGSKWMMTDSYLIDEIKELYNREMYDQKFFAAADMAELTDDQIMLYLNGNRADEYWRGKSWGDSERLEVVAEELIVTEVDIENFPSIGDQFKVVKELPAQITTYFEPTKYSPEVFKNIFKKYLKATPNIRKSAIGNDLQISDTIALPVGLTLYVYHVMDPVQMHTKDERKEYNVRPVVIFTLTNNSKENFPYIPIPIDMSKYKNHLQKLN